MTYPDTKRGPRRAILPLIIGLHLLAVFFMWQSQRGAVRSNSGPEPAPILLYLSRAMPVSPALPSQPPLVLRPQPRPQQAPVPPARTAPPPPTPLNSPTPPATSPVPDLRAATVPAPITLSAIVPPQAVTDHPTGSLAANAKRDIGKIDRDLRKESTIPQIGPVAASKSPMEQAFDRAALSQPGDGMVSKEETVLPNGTRVARVKGPLGTYCVRTESVGSSNGTDFFQRGPRTKVSNCPR